MIKTLIIEDEAKSRQMLAAMLERNCPEITIAGLAKDVKEGVAMIKELQPDLVFLDISMPDGSGFDLLEQVSGHKFELIFATASD
ncbi:MAG: response regulator, partial [Bacteroidota bacterium]